MTVNDSLSFQKILRRQLRFYLTNPTPCPYLPGKVERKVFTNIAVHDSEALHDTLSHNGFRRSQTIAYRPACSACNACTAVRVDVSRFKFSKRWKRVLRRNDMLQKSPRPTVATREQYRLLKKYLQSRHDGGGMSSMSFAEYVAMVEETPIQSLVYEYRDSNTSGSPLVAGAITDVLRDGLSMVYTYFDPDRSDQSLGSFLILDHIATAQELGIPYVYLGYWVRGSQKMDYKSQFQPLEMLKGTTWVPFESREGGNGYYKNKLAKSA